MRRLESCLARLERRKQVETMTLVVVCDDNFYGNAHLLPRKAGVGDRQAAERDEETASEPGGEDDDKTALGGTP